MTATKYSGPKLPPGVSATPGKPKADGSVTWYFYYKPTKTKLLQTPGTAAFAREVQRAANVGPVELVVKADTLADLCDRFEKSAEHTDCGASARAKTELVFKRLRDKWAEYDCEQLSDKRFRGEIKQWRDEYRDRPAAADMNVVVLRRLLSWAEDNGDVDVNRARNIGKLADSRPRAGKGVTPEMHDNLMDTGTPEDIDLYLFARWTGIRKADICRIKWTDIDGDGWIEWLHSKTAKTSKAISFIPTRAFRPLADLIARQPRKSEYLLASRYSPSWEPGNIDSRWDLWRIRAGIKFDDLHFHDLRRQCIQDHLEAGCSNAQAASISGHTIANANEGSFERYATRGRQLGLEAYRKLDAHLGGTAGPADNNVVALRHS